MKEVEINKDFKGSFSALVTVSEPISFPYFREWLSTFNTNSATACFTAVQNLKGKVDFKEKI